MITKVLLAALTAYGATSLAPASDSLTTQNDKTYRVVCKNGIEDKLISGNAFNHNDMGYSRLIENMHKSKAIDSERFLANTSQFVSDNVSAAPHIYTYSHRGALLQDYEYLGSNQSHAFPDNIMHIVAMTKFDLTMAVTNEYLRVRNQRSATNYHLLHLETIEQVADLTSGSVYELRSKHVENLFIYLRRPHVLEPITSSYITLANSLVESYDRVMDHFFEEILQGGYQFKAAGLFKAIKRDPNGEHTWTDFFDTFVFCSPHGEKTWAVGSDGPFEVGERTFVK